MPKWKYGNKTLTKQEVENSLNAMKNNVCFHCETHNDECSISRTAKEIKEMIEE